MMQNLCKIGLNPAELELLEYALVIAFFSEKIVSEGSPTFFKFSFGSSC